MSLLTYSAALVACQNVDFMARIQRALLSVTDKRGIVDFARSLAQLNIELVSTGGTAAALRQAGLPVREVTELTGFPEILDGRVKTLHPLIAGGILARRSDPHHRQAVQRHGIPWIDMVVVNLYQFEKVAEQPGVDVEDLVEQIDIGGPTMIRAAAKNWQDVAVVVSPDDYTWIAEEVAQRQGELSRSTRWRLACRAFALTAAYDSAIAARLSRLQCHEQGFNDSPEALPEFLHLAAPLRFRLRYGENPHQQAALYGRSPHGIAGALQLQGKELSYNNLVDLDAAWQLVSEFEQPAAVIIKHTNPCGCAERGTLAESYRSAFEADPVSAFGGVLGFNRLVDEETAREVTKTFVEAVAAPGYSPASLQIFGTKKNLRLVQVTGGPPEPVLRSITGGYLLQTPDIGTFVRERCETKTQRAPSEEEWRALAFAWKVVKHVKSNAIVYARAGQVVSVGAGQMSRVDAVRVGAMKAVLPLAGTVLASDAFFPFPDGVEEAARHGVTAIIQPGGSVRDADVIAAADRLGLAMVFTGVRHFRH
jgi:phosphoribosylaminoimidazolecarboxamide formyltransferase/IMP cyclohydrolase